EETPSLFTFSQRADRASKLLQFLGEVVVNGNPTVPRGSRPARLRQAAVPPADPETAVPEGTRDVLLRLGPEAFARWVCDQRRLLVTDTTLRDAHQSLLATRLRTYDMLQAAGAIARDFPSLFSLEMWGGATFDVAMRFLFESPWER